MPLVKILLKPGVNRENTRYTTEGGWYACDKVRFRQGSPETIGGWVPYTLNTFKGVCRLLWNWATLAGNSLIALGTSLKFYICQGQQFYDITPIRRTVTLGTNPFTVSASTDGGLSQTVTVSDTGYGATVGDFVTFSNITDPTLAVLNGEFQITTLVNTNSYQFKLSPASLSAGTVGGTGVVAAYQLNVGPAYAVPLTGWGASTWGTDPWGTTGASPIPSSTSLTQVSLWSAQNYGQDLVFGPRGGGIYYWSASAGTSTRGAALNAQGGTVTFTVASPTVVTFNKKMTAGMQVQFTVSSGGALPTGISGNTTYTVFNVNGMTANLLDSSGNLVNVSGAGSGVFSVSLLVDVPTVQAVIMVSDSSRFVFAFGCNDYGYSTQDKMLVRWSDQDNPYVWTPDATNQAGSIRLSHGSEIVTVIQTRQELVAITDSSVYSLQYLGPPVVWGTQLLGDNISIAGQNAAVLASGVIYWMGIDKFYVYDGRVQTLNCDIRKFVFSNFNTNQRSQVYAGTNEGFNEVWWFYPSAGNDPDNPPAPGTNPTLPNYCDRYVVYNYLERVWYYGTLNRTAWLDSGILTGPVATTYNSTTSTGRLINHEYGLNDDTDGTAKPLNAHISSSEFDIGDGHNYSFIWRVLPDLTFNNSDSAPDGASPTVTMTLAALNSSGSGVNDGAAGAVKKLGTVQPVDIVAERFTGQINTRVRGRQLIMKVESNQLNTSWQLGAARLDIRPDGRKS